MRFLTALRNSDLGVENLNKRNRVSVASGKKLLWFRNEQDWYIGKPIMITENDHNVRLYNGDIGHMLGKWQSMVWQSRSADKPNSSA